MDHFLSYFDHLPTYRGLPWTFGALPTLCPRGHRKKSLPPCISEFHNKYLVLKLFITYNFQANLAYRPILLILINKSCQSINNFLSIISSFWTRLFLMPLSFWILVHVDIGLTTYLPFVDNHGHLTDHLLGFPRDVPGQTGTGRPVVPLSRDKKKFLSRCPFVPGQGQEQMSRDKLLCPGTSRDKITFLFCSSIALFSYLCLLLQFFSLPVLLSLSLFISMPTY